MGLLEANAPGAVMPSPAPVWLPELPISARLDQFPFARLLDSERSARATQAAQTCRRPREALVPPGYKFATTTERRMKRSHPLEGLKIGAAIGGFFSLLILLSGLVDGSRYVSSHGQVLDTWASAAGYLVGALLGGVVVGILIPFTKHKLAAGCVGILGFAPVSVGIMIGLATDGWTNAHTITAVLLSLALGGVVGSIILPLVHES